MSTQTRSLAMLASNPAFSSILCRTLEADGNYRVASFGGVEALTTFLRISPVDAVILDCDVPGAPAADIARGLRHHLKLASAEFAILALSRAAAPFHRPLLAAGIDLVLQKPATPRQLLDAIDGLLTPVRQVAAAHQPADRPAPPRAPSVHAVPRTGNVISLFGEGRAPR